MSPEFPEFPAREFPVPYDGNSNTRQPRVKSAAGELSVLRHEPPEGRGGNAGGEAGPHADGIGAWPDTLDTVWMQSSVVPRFSR